MKRVALLVTFFFLHFQSTSNLDAQTTATSIVVGDTSLLAYGTIARDSYCGNVQFVDVTGVDSINFIAKVQFVSGGFSYWIYFVPHEKKVYDQNVHIAYGYANKAGCNYPYPGVSFSFHCLGVIDTIFHFTRKVMDVHLDIDIERQNRKKNLQIPCKNSSTTSLEIDSIKCLNIAGPYYRINLDSAVYSKGIVVIPPSSNVDSISCFLTSTWPPDESFKTVPALIFGQLGTQVYIDTIYLRTNSDWLPQQYSSSLTNIHFRVPYGEHVDTIFFVHHTKLAHLIRISDPSQTSPSFPYQLLSYADDSELTTVVIRCNPADSSIHQNQTNFLVTYQIVFNLFDLGYHDLVIPLSFEYFLNQVNATQTVGEPTLSLLPNPAKSMINIYLSDDLWEERIRWLGIYDIRGILVKSENPFTNRFQMNITGLSPGSYYLRAKTQKRIFAQKFIVE